LTVAAAVDRAGAVRVAVRRLVAARGFHGASMSAIAREAGVATGTAYVHYASKDELVLAAYVESKLELGRAATAALAPDDAPEQLFRTLWLAAYRHLAGSPAAAAFLLQVDDSPYAERAHALMMERDDDPLALVADARAIAARLRALPPEVLYELGIAPAVRLAARRIELTDEQLEQVAGACWRAISRPA